MKMMTMVVTTQKLHRRLLMMPEIRLMAIIWMLMMVPQVSSLVLLLSYFYLLEQELDTGLSKASKVVLERPVVVLSQFKIKNMMKFRPKILKQNDFHELRIFYLYFVDSKNSKPIISDTYHLLAATVYFLYFAMY